MLPGHPGQVDFTARQETLDRMSSIYENNNSYLNCGSSWKCGFIAQLIEHHTSICRGHGLESCWSPDFFRLLSNCFNWKIYCDDHSSLSSMTAVQMWIISYILHIISLLMGRYELNKLTSLLIAQLVEHHTSISQTSQVQIL